MLRLGLFIYLFPAVSSILDGRLKHFEVLGQDSLKHHISKRDIYTQYPDERKVDYDAFGRHFQLVLHRSDAVLSPDFRVIAINGVEERVVDIRPNIYHGFLEGESNSSVTAYWEDESVLSASIKTESEVFILEPSWRHLPNDSNATMITYKASDLDMKNDLGDKYCSFIRVNATNEEGYSEVEEEESDNKQSHSSRVKRQAGQCVIEDKKTCALLLVADYRFYESMSQKSIAKTTSYLISQIDRIDAIYQEQEFGSCGRGLGFEIKEIRIHESPTPTPTSTGQSVHYNMRKEDWDTTQLLEAFSTDPAFENFCLAHLFTHTAFDNGVLGLAYIGSPRSYSVGGICSPSYMKSGTKMFLNTGWSSSLNKYKRKLLTQEATLVTAHEFGHNWGSEHDPDSNECSPPASSGGKYIMFTYSVSGIDSNNKIFSPCSKRAIGTVLRAKATNCFSKRAGGFCGNLRVEGEEQCDEGPQSTGGSSTTLCCTDKCKFKPGALCSDANQDCCTGCKFSGSDKVCYTQQDALCEQESKCSGTSGTCPAALPKPDGSECLERGHCRNKTCLPYCEYYHKISCICDKVETSCKWCCKDNASGDCRPFTADNKTVSSFDLPDGMPCIQGFCDKGTCKKQVHDMVQRLWDIIENITADKLVKFMRANIVGTVIILSLVLWIPGSCIVAYIDRKKAREDKDVRDWHDPSNVQLVKEQDNKNIKQTQDVKNRVQWRKNF